MSTRQVQGELPGDVLVHLRECKGYVMSPKAFAGLTNWGYDKLHRLELLRWNEWDGKEPPRAASREDLEDLINAGWLEKGDDWYLRFETAFQWQHWVMVYGKQVYKEGIPEHSLYEPVTREHVIALVEVVARRVVLGAGDLAQASEAQLKSIIDRVSAEVLFRLSTPKLLRFSPPQGPITPDNQTTRWLPTALAAGGLQAADNPYVRTLRLVYEWANELLVDYGDEPAR